MDILKDIFIVPSKIEMLTFFFFFSFIDSFSFSINYKLKWRGGGMCIRIVSILIILWQADVRDFVHVYQKRKTETKIFIAENYGQIIGFLYEFLKSYLLLLSLFVNGEPV